MRRVLIVDGGLATELERRGHVLHPELWSAGVFLADPQAVGDLHAAYLEAGADVIISASYQMSFAGLARCGLDEPAARRALCATVEVAQRAVQRVGRKALVAASVGPYGAALADGSEYRGNYGRSVASLKEFHRPRLEVLAGAGADLLAIETIPDLDEAQALCELLGAGSAQRAWISFCCADEAHLADGRELAAAARIADRCPAIAAVGINCTHPSLVAGLIERIRSVSAKPLVVYPNSGERWDGVAHRWSGEPSTEEFLRLAEGWAAMGAWAIGGCCRIGPEVIRELARRLGATG